MQIISWNACGDLVVYSPDCRRYYEYAQATERDLYKIRLALSKGQIGKAWAICKSLPLTRKA